MRSHARPSISICPSHITQCMCALVRLFRPCICLSAAVHLQQAVETAGPLCCPGRGPSCVAPGCGPSCVAPGREPSCVALGTHHRSTAQHTASTLHSRRRVGSSCVLLQVFLFIGIPLRRHQGPSYVAAFLHGIRWYARRCGPVRQAHPRPGLHIRTHAHVSACMHGTVGARGDTVIVCELFAA